jgi:hypothetical protein
MRKAMEKGELSDIRLRWLQAFGNEAMLPALPLAIPSLTYGSQISGMAVESDKWKTMLARRSLDDGFCRQCTCSSGRRLKI